VGVGVGSGSERGEGKRRDELGSFSSTGPNKIITSQIKSK
jgi:hypothetical protein